MKYSQFIYQDFLTKNIQGPTFRGVHVCEVHPSKRRSSTGVWANGRRLSAKELAAPTSAARSSPPECSPSAASPPAAAWEPGGREHRHGPNPALSRGPKTHRLADHVTRSLFAALKTPRHAVKVGHKGGG